MQKIAIHHRPQSYSVEWIKYCQNHGIPYKIVNCYSSDIIEQLEGCSGLMWHWPQWDYKAVLFARQLTYSLELKGMKVFPDSHTSWHYDDKVGQKYLLESLGIPFVPTHIFYDQCDALRWAKKTSFPKVFKLTGGASSMNVKLIHTHTEARKIIKKAFHSGFSLVDRRTMFRDKILDHKRERSWTTLFNAFKAFLRLFVPTRLEKISAKEKGYVYFQDFIPGNTFDIRIYVIGEHAYGLKRMVRENDFRASGSHNFIFDPDQIDSRCVRIAFESATKLQLQCVAFDFIFDNGTPLITEISYASVVTGYRKCPGFWDRQLVWHEGRTIEEEFMMQDFINSINQQNPVYQI